MPAPKAPFAPRLSAELAPVAPGPTEFATDLVLEDADWRDAAMAGERAEFAEITTSRLGASDFSGSDWYRSSWIDVDSDGLDLANAQFTECGLRRVALRNGRLTGIGLAGCAIEDTLVSGCVVDLANLRFAKLTRVRFENCSLVGSEFISAPLTDVAFVDCDLSAVQFTQATCRRVRISGCRLDGVRGVEGLRGATIAPVDLTALTHQLAAALGIAVDWDS